ncbi:MAG: translation initiation factor [Bacteroidia bacterium]|nr:MAG: translation initiation factor [Bacteroidia bacterium]
MGKQEHDWQDMLASLRAEMPADGPEDGGAGPECEGDAAHPPQGVEAIARRQFRVFRQRKGRAGKTVTMIEGRGLSPDEAEALLVHLKRRCGCGGLLRDGLLELQGDKRVQAKGELEAMGHGVQLGN